MEKRKPDFAALCGTFFCISGFAFIAVSWIRLIPSVIIANILIGILIIILVIGTLFFVLHQFLINHSEWESTLKL